MEMINAGDAALFSMGCADISVAPNIAPTARGLQDRVAIIIVNWNGWRDSIECLDTVLSQDHGRYTVVVVDNDSADASVEKICNWCEHPFRAEGSKNIEGVRRISDEHLPHPINYKICRLGEESYVNDLTQVFIVESGANLGFAGGCNAGVRFVADGDFDYIWFLNSDTAVDESSLSALIIGASAMPVGGMIGSTLLYYRRPTVIQARGGADLSLSDCVIRHRDEGCDNSLVTAAGAPSHSLTYVVGASMLVPVSLIDTIGEMQDDYFLYYEEIDWAFRSRGRYRQGLASLSIVYHKAGASSKDKVSEFSKRLLFRNKIIFFSRYIPHLRSRLRLEMLKELVRDMVKGRWRVANVLFKVLNSSAIPGLGIIISKEPI